MRKGFIDKLNKILIILLLGFFLFFQTFLIIERYHSCDNEDCPICEIIAEASNNDTYVSSSTVVIVSIQVVIIPFLFVFKNYTGVKDTLIRLKVRLNN